MQAVALPFPNTAALSPLLCVYPARWQVWQRWPRLVAAPVVWFCARSLFRIYPRN